MSEEYLMMVWDCAFCGNSKILGDQLSCPNCGRERTTACYLPDEEILITDKAGIAAAEAGPDWRCGSCGTMNSADMENCRNCSSSASGGTKNKVVEFDPEDRRQGELEPQAQEESPSPMAWRNSASDAPNIERYTRTIESEEPKSFGGSKKSPSKLGFLLIFFVLGLGTALTYFLLRPQKVTVAVEAFEWHRQINLEKYVWVAENNLSGYPQGSRNQDRKWEIVGYHEEFSHYETKYRTEYERVKSGQDCSYTDLGNGRTKRTCVDHYINRSKQVPYQVEVKKRVPDHGWRYYYEAQRWVHSRSLPTNGSDRQPYWATFSLAVDPPEREVANSETYKIHYVSREKEPRRFTREVAYTEWVEYDARALYEIETNALGTILKIEKLPPQ